MHVQLGSAVSWGSRQYAGGQGCCRRAFSRLKGTSWSSAKLSQAVSLGPSLIKWYRLEMIIQETAKYMGLFGRQGEDNPALYLDGRGGHQHPSMCQVPGRGCSISLALQGRYTSPGSYLGSLSWADMGRREQAEQWHLWGWNRGCGRRHQRACLCPQKREGTGSKECDSCPWVVCRSRTRGNRQQLQQKKI